MPLNMRDMIQLYTQKQIKDKEECSYWSSTFPSLSRVFNNEHNLYTKISVKPRLA